MTRISIICARGGSKGVPGKNIRPLGGRPLIAWTVSQAVATELFDVVAVSSDSHEILDAAGEAGAGLLVDRPAAMADDTAPVHLAIMHCLTAAEASLGTQAESFTFLQATSPFRAPEDIQRGVEMWDDYRPGSVVSATPAHGSPYFTLLEETPVGTVELSKRVTPPITRRQDAPRCWNLNGAVYVFDRTRYAEKQQVLFPDTRIIEMPPERSLDIDTEFDWRVAEALWRA